VQGEVGRSRERVLAAVQSGVFTVPFLPAMELVIQKQEQDSTPVSSTHGPLNGVLLNQSYNFGPFLNIITNVGRRIKCCKNVGSRI
jgi:hypothetical protein